MPKRRIVLDGDIDNPVHEAMSLLARLLWDRLWKTCDFWGRERWRADVLKILCFPEDKRVEVRHIEKVMKEIEGGSNLLFIYSVDERQFYQLVDWEKAFKGEHRGDSSIPEPPKDAGSQMKLAPQRLSTEKSTKTPIAGLGLGLGTDIVKVESPSGKKPIEKSGKLTKEKLLSMAKAGEDIGFEDIKHLSFKAQNEIRAAIPKPAAAVPERKPPDIMTDEEVAEQEQCSLEDARGKRAKGIVFYKGGHR